MQAVETRIICKEIVHDFVLNVCIYVDINNLRCLASNGNTTMCLRRVLRMLKLHGEGDHDALSG